MINSNSISRIVVGIGLAAVVGIGVYEFNVHAEQQQENRIALNASAPAMPDLTSQNAGDALTPDLSAPPTAPPEAAPTPSTTSNVADEPKPAKSRRSDRQVAKTRSTEPTPAETVVLPASSATSRSALTASNSPDSVTSRKEMTPTPSSSDTTSAATAATTADSQPAPAPAQPGQIAATSTGPAATSSTPVASDSQITAYVKSEIATAAPNSNVDVKTTNGVVALAGSVPSQDAIDQAKQAAQRVAGVKFVDATALMVSNQ
ncbi:MAG TPA: BON domain-containing protein [Steroidobacteraceae bacterium]|nr:BON domain-containing protein [Steroidobacteraceae bacterium]